jgi:hypothetical protein
MDEVLSIADVALARGISEILHFTTNNGFVGSLEVGSVLSRRRLPEEKHLAYVAAPTADREENKDWFDKSEDWLDYVNMSISEINFRFFNFAKRRHAGSDRWFLILSFSPEILSCDGVYFTTTNNIYEPHVRRLRGSSGLEGLFASSIQRKSTWVASRKRRAAHLPTCEQAEVLYPGSVSLDYLTKVYVLTDDDADHAVGCLARSGRKNVTVVVDPIKFNGQPN